MGLAGCSRGTFLLPNSQPCLLPSPCCRACCPRAAQDERDQFQLKQFLMVVRAYSDPSQQPDAAGGSGSSKQQQQGKKKKQKGAAAADSSGVVHFLPEAECYQAAADWSFTFPAADRLVGKDELQPCRCVMLVSAKGMAAAHKQLAALMKAAAQ